MCNPKVHERGYDMAAAPVDMDMGEGCIDEHVASALDMREGSIDDVTAASLTMAGLTMAVTVAAPSPPAITVIVDLDRM